MFVVHKSLRRCESDSLDALCDVFSLIICLFDAGVLLEVVRNSPLLLRTRF